MKKYTQEELDKALIEVLAEYYGRDDFVRLCYGRDDFVRPEHLTDYGFSISEELPYYVPFRIGETWRHWTDKSVYKDYICIDKDGRFTFYDIQLKGIYDTWENFLLNRDPFKDGGMELMPTLDMLQSVYFEVSRGNEEFKKIFRERIFWSRNQKNIDEAYGFHFGTGEVVSGSKTRMLNAMAIYEYSNQEVAYGLSTYRLEKIGWEFINE